MEAVPALFSSRFWEMSSDPLKRLVRLTRTDQSFDSVSDVRIANDEVIQAMRLEHSRWGLVVDMRGAPARTDPGFEAAMRPLREAVERRYARTALLLSSAVGMLQVNRLTRDEGATTFVTTDENEAIDFALGEHDAASRV